MVPEEISHRGEIEQVVILLRGLLRRCLGAEQLLVLHFQLDLVDLQLVDQGARVGFGQVQNKLLSQRAYLLLRLAAQFGRLGRSAICVFLLAHAFP